MPSSPSRKADLARLIALPFAHRGLHGPGVPENSRAAFRAAIAAGHGIELDVRASGSGAVYVFHDETLERLTDGTGAFLDLTPAALAATRLRGCDEAVPALSEALALIAGRVPLLVEVKAPRRRIAPLCAAVEAALAGYEGPVAVMSFNPEVARWFSAHAPQRLRGLVVTESGRKGLRGRIERPLSLWGARAEPLPPHPH
ncbi:MAG: glycerophosphodiester phosphodiesterase family protein, partial [Allosphingosinicella sp.]